MLKDLNKIPLILASRSPRRAELLDMLKISYVCMPADIDETIGGKPEDEAKRIAVNKALAVSEKIKKDAVILAADTIVVLDEHILGKPSSEKEAIDMLSLLSGKTHAVITGVCLYDTGKKKADAFFEKTKVTFRSLSTEEIKAYVKTKEPMDKAGAYAIQGIGSVFVKKINGDFYNVVGLPLVKTIHRLTKMSALILL